MSGDRYCISDQNAIYFVTFTVVGWIDVFTSKAYKLEIVKSMNFCTKEKGLNVFAWCIMTNHLHLIISAKDGFRLSDIIRDFKKIYSQNNGYKNVVYQIIDVCTSRFLHTCRYHNHRFYY